MTAPTEHPHRQTLIPATEMRRQIGCISTTTEARWLKDGSLPQPVKIERKKFYIQGEIDDFIQKLTQSSRRRINA